MGKCFVEFPANVSTLFFQSHLRGLMKCMVYENFQDTVLLERHKLTSGTTWHAAGLVGALRATASETHLSVAGQVRTIGCLHRKNIA